MRTFRDQVPAYGGCCGFGKVWGNLVCVSNYILSRTVR